MFSVRKHFPLEAANFSLFALEGEITSCLIPGPAWSLGYSSPNTSRDMPQRNIFYFYFFIFIFFFFFFLFIYFFFFIFFFFFFEFHLQFISGAINYTGASFCATSYYLPRAYNAPLGGALVYACGAYKKKIYQFLLLPWMAC